MKKYKIENESIGFFLNCKIEMSKSNPYDNNPNQGKMFVQFTNGIWL